MAKYRIVEATFPNGEVKYYIQKKFLFWWFNHFLPLHKGDFSIYNGFPSFKYAEEILCRNNKIKPIEKVIKEY